MSQQDFFKRYRYDRKRDRIGTGAMGVVFRAYDTITDQYVVIKIKAVDDEDSDLRLAVQVKALNSLPPHRGVAMYIDCVTVEESTGSVDCAVRPYYPMGTLAKYMSSHKLTSQQATQVVAQVAETLEMLHSHGFTRNRFAPENMLVAMDGDNMHVKLSDAGVAPDLSEGTDQERLDSLAKYLGVTLQTEKKADHTTVVESPEPEIRPAEDASEDAIAVFNEGVRPRSYKRLWMWIGVGVTWMAIGLLIGTVHWMRSVHAESEVDIKTVTPEIEYPADSFRQTEEPDSCDTVAMPTPVVKQVSKSKSITSPIQEQNDAESESEASEVSPTTESVQVVQESAAVKDEPSSPHSSAEL